MISVICPVYNEEPYIAACIDSILKQDFPLNQMELILVDGRSTDRTRDIICWYAEKYPFIRLLDNPFKTVPYALNLAIGEAKGDVIVRLDGHCGYPKNYLSVLVRNLQELNADNVGGICETLPADDSSISVAIATALSCSFGMGNSYFRIGTKHIIAVDTVPFGCFNRTIFDKIGMYDVDLIRNQDDELNARIIKNGGKIFLIPDVKVKYFARNSFSKVWNMFYQYGLYKPLVNKKLGSPATLRQFFPVAFLCGLILGGLLSLFSSAICWIYFTVLLLYFLIGLLIGVKQAIKKSRLSLIFFLPYTFSLIHISYGWGYLVGIYKILRKSNFSANTNR